MTEEDYRAAAGFVPEGKWELGEPYFLFNI